MTLQSNMIRKSMPIAADHISPLATGEIDHSYENLKVRLLFWPEEKPFKRMVYKATMATRGSPIDDLEKVDPVVVDEAFKGGLNQCLEWATVVFEISGLSRGVTHEIVRTRKASFAQQSMRHTDMGSDPEGEGVAAMRMPEAITRAPVEAQEEWEHAVEVARQTYAVLVNEYDIPFQDARTVLPIATETYIICSYPVSEFLSTFSYRGCYMFYPEIVSLFHRMRSALLEVCPWLAPYTLISCEKTRLPHQCTYQGWERVEGQCPFTWAKEDNRVWKSTKFEG
jgi:flavin-dependent thymidylate synthase